MAECNRKSLSFSRLRRQEIVANFDGGRLTSDAGGLLLREVDLRLGKRSLSPSPARAHGRCLRSGLFVSNPRRRKRAGTVHGPSTPCVFRWSHDVGFR